MLRRFFTSVTSLSLDGELTRGPQTDFVAHLAPQLQHYTGSITKGIASKLDSNILISFRPRIERNVAAAVLAAFLSRTWPHLEVFDVDAIASPELLASLAEQGRFGSLKFVHFAVYDRLSEWMIGQNASMLKAVKEANPQLESFQFGCTPGSSSFGASFFEYDLRVWDTVLGSAVRNSPKSAAEIYRTNVGLPLGSLLIRRSQAWGVAFALRGGDSLLGRTKAGEMASLPQVVSTTEALFQQCVNDDSATAPRLVSTLEAAESLLPSSSIELPLIECLLQKIPPIVAKLGPMQTPLALHQDSPSAALLSVTIRLLIRLSRGGYSARKIEGAHWPHFSALLVRVGLPVPEVLQRLVQWQLTTPVHAASIQEGIDAFSHSHLATVQCHVCGALVPAPGPPAEATTLSI